MATFETKLTIMSWDEKPYRELPDGRKFNRAEVRLTGEGPGQDGQTGFTDACFEGLLHYRADGTSTYVMLFSITGAIDGRHGTLVLTGLGSFDGTTARSECQVIEATGELAGLTGTATSVSTHSDYPHMPLVLTYEHG